MDPIRVLAMARIDIIVNWLLAQVPLASGSVAGSAIGASALWSGVPSRPLGPIKAHVMSLQFFPADSVAMFPMQCWLDEDAAKRSASLSGGLPELDGQGEEYERHSRLRRNSNTDTLCRWTQPVGCVHYSYRKRRRHS